MRNVLTIADCADIATELGLCETEANWLVGAMAPDRHFSRVLAAEEAAMDWAAQSGLTGAALYAYAYIVCSMDINGVGGPADAGGTWRASVRHPAFSGFPRPKQAAGPAWCAAIAAAKERLRVSVEDHLGSGVSWAVSPAGDIIVSGSHGDVTIPFTWLDAEWRRSLRRRQLLVMARKRAMDIAGGCGRWTAYGVSYVD